MIDKLSKERTSFKYDHRGESGFFQFLLFRHTILTFCRNTEPFKSAATMSVSSASGAPGSFVSTSTTATRPNLYLYSPSSNTMIPCEEIIMPSPVLGYQVNNCQSLVYGSVNVNDIHPDNASRVPAISTWHSQSITPRLQQLRPLSRRHPATR